MEIVLVLLNGWRKILMQNRIYVLYFSEIVWYNMCSSMRSRVGSAEREFLSIVEYIHHKT